MRKLFPFANLFVILSLSLVLMPGGPRPTSAHAATAAPAPLPAYMYHLDQVDETGIVYHFDFDGTQPGDQQTITAQPGAAINGSIEWQAWSGAGNPAEIGQVMLIYSWEGVTPTDYSCLFSSIIGVDPGTHRTDAFSFEAPQVAGRYDVWVQRWAHYSCAQAAADLTAIPVIGPKNWTTC